MNVSVAELRQIATQLFHHLEHRGYDELTLKNDYYWEIDREQRYDPNRDPSEFTLGQVSHDVERLRRIGSGEDEPVAYALVWLAAVLREAGEQVLG